MAGIAKKSPIRSVKLEQVAEYLRCDPKRLQIALKHLSATTTEIEYSPAAAVLVVQANERIITAAWKMARRLGHDSIAAGIVAAVNSAVRPTIAAGQTLDTRPIDPQVAKWVN